MEPLKGLKTYIGMAVLGLTGIVTLLNWVDTDTAKWILAVVGPATGVSMRMGMSKR